jgi:hypothetical protein
LTFHKAQSLGLVTMVAVRIAQAKDTSIQRMRLCKEYEDVDCMIQGFIDRLDETARYVSYLHKQGLGHMTVRLKNKMDNCARAIARLRQYRIKLMKL